MLVSSLLFPLVLATSAIAYPHVHQQHVEGGLNPRTTTDTKHSADGTKGEKGDKNGGAKPIDPKTDKCDAHATETIAETSAVLGLTEMLPWLDNMLLILPKHEDNWVNKLYTYLNQKSGAAPTDGCGLVDSSCDFNIDCGDWIVPEAYWVYRSVGLLHSKYQTLNQQLRSNAWMASMYLDDITADFSMPTPDVKILEMTSMAFGMASGFGTAAGINQVMRGMSTVAAAGFASMAKDKQSLAAVDKSSMQNTLINIVKIVGNSFADILKNATGNGDPSHLPATGDAKYNYGTTKFFADPSILLDLNADNATFMKAYNSFGGELTKKMTDLGMKTAWYMLLADTKIKEEKCNRVGMGWIEAKGQHYCFYLTRAKDVHLCEGEAGVNPETCKGNEWGTNVDSIVQFPSELYTKLTSKYGLDLAEYYTHLIDCAINGNGNVDFDNWQYDGKAPRCYYNVAVRKGYFEQYQDAEPAYLKFGGKL